MTGRLTVEAVSGDVDATITGEAAISARTVSGDLALRAATIATLRATTTSGDIRLAGRLDGPGPFTIESVSGDALLALAGDVRVDLQTVAGDLRSEIPGRSESRPGRRSMTIGSGGSTLSVRTMSGDVRIVRASPVTRDERAAALAHDSRPSWDARPGGRRRGPGPDRCRRRRASGHPSRPRTRARSTWREATRRLEASIPSASPRRTSLRRSAVPTDETRTEITTDDSHDRRHDRPTTPRRTRTRDDRGGHRCLTTPSTSSFGSLPRGD